MDSLGNGFWGLLFGATAAVSILMLFFGIRYSNKRRAQELQRAMAPVVHSKRGLLKEDDKAPGLLDRYKTAWTTVCLQAGLGDTVSRNMVWFTLAAAVLVMVLVYSLTSVVVFAVFVSLAPPAFTWLYLSLKATKRSLLIEKEMSSFVTSIHMYIQSGLQPVSAIMQAVDATPEPLKSELMYLVISLRNNENERVAFRRLRDRTGNPDLKELCSNISIALAEGSEVGKQLLNLGETVRAKSELRGKIQSELQDPRMTAVIGFLSFFIFFGISWFSQEGAAETWGSLQGEIVLAVISSIAAIGGVWAFRIIKRAQEIA